MNAHTHFVNAFALFLPSSCYVTTVVMRETIFSALILSLEGSS